MANAATKFKQINVPFSLINSPIDYFELHETYFKPGFNVKRYVTKLLPWHYFSLPQNFKLDEKETVVFNFQVGQGKTTLCYDLIEQYEKKGYFVIVCSPFIKLVNKDYEEIKLRVEKKITTGLAKGVIPKVFKYDDVNVLNHWGAQMKNVAAHSRSVHIMTINCLLGNSGNNNYEQSFSKQQYLQDLIDVAKKRNQKIVLFIDELHESINNFSPLYIPNLLKLQGLVNKVFIASATFTPSTIPIIKTFSLLTDKKIKIFETERVKNKTQANIYLHVCNVPNYPTNEFEEIIKNKIALFQSNGKDINIITGTKSIAENIATSNLFTKVNKNGAGNLSVNEINLLTGDTEIEYQKGQNNIGTTFKTGINITGKNDILFVVLPNLSTNVIEYYGIFSDGITSIIQAIGRLRNGGGIHLFIKDPENLIGDKQDYDKFFDNKTFSSHLPINKLHEELIKKYHSILKGIRNEIIEMEKDLGNSKGKSIEIQKGEFGFSYPNEQEFLLNNSQGFALRHDNFSFGKLLSPYIIWSCLNDQFINGKLKGITYYNKPAISLNNSNSATIFSGILSKHSRTLKSLGFRKSISDAGKYIKEYDENGETEQLKYEINGKSINAGEIVSRQPTHLNEITKATFEICTGLKFPDSKQAYINACLNEAELNKTGLTTTLGMAYTKLGVIKKEFINRIKKNTKAVNGVDYIPQENYKIIDDVFQKEIIEVVNELKEHDLLLKNKAFSFMQDNPRGANAKKATYKMLAELFLKLDKTKKQISNKSYYQLMKIDPKDNISLSGLL